MTMELKDKLTSFKALTIELIEALKIETFDELEQLFLQRQQVIEQIDSIDHTADEFAKLCEDLGIMELQEQLAANLIEKKQRAKQQLDKFLDQKNANKSYNNQFSPDSLYFNKKF